MKNASEKGLAAPFSTSVRQQTTFGMPALRTALPSASDSQPLRKTSSRGPPRAGLNWPSMLASVAGLTATSSLRLSVKARVRCPSSSMLAWPMNMNARGGRVHSSWRSSFGSRLRT